MRTEKENYYFGLNCRETGAEILPSKFFPEFINSIKLLPLNDLLKIKLLDMTTSMRPDGLYEFKDDNGRIGLKDYTGKIIVKPKYTNIGLPDYRTRLSPVSISFYDKNKNKTKLKWGVIDSGGIEIVKPQYDAATISWFHTKQNDYILLRNGSRYGFTNDKAKNNIIVKPEYSYLTLVNHKYALQQEIYKHKILIMAKKIGEENKYGIINLAGKVLIEPKYGAIFSYLTANKFLITRLKKSFNGEVKLGLITKFGRIFCEPIYDDIYDANYKSLIIAKYNGLYGILNSKGELIVPHEYINIQYFRTVNSEIVEKLTGKREVMILAQARHSNGDWHYITKDGEVFENNKKR